MSTSQQREVSEIVDSVGLVPAAAWFGLTTDSLNRFLANQTIRNATKAVIDMKLGGRERPKAPPAKPAAKSATAAPANKPKKLKKKVKASAAPSPKLAAGKKLKKKLKTKTPSSPPPAPDSSSDAT